MRNNFFLFTGCFLLSILPCFAQKHMPIKVPATFVRNRLPVKVKECWQHLDIEQDTIPGTSLKRAYQDIIKNKKGKKIIVAVIDTGIDIHHEDLKDAIWVNKKEIPNNGIDDDHNGYIDDINGWNFLSSSKVENVIYANLEATRLLRSLKKKYATYPDFKGNKADSLMYTKATEQYKKEKATTDDLKEYATSELVNYRKGIIELEKNFHKTQFNLSEYDSLYWKNKNTHPEWIDNILFMRDIYRLGKDYELLKNDSIRIDDQYKTVFNDSYYDRAIIGDNELDMKDIHYGNNNVYKDAAWTYHGTIVSGVIAANRANKIGIEGFSDQIEIMPIRAVPTAGLECNKDIALAIRYAVDNGAKIINMSFGNPLLYDYTQWIKDAFVYAEQHNVLLIAGSGNDMEDNDNIPFYPIDYDVNTGKEFCNNFIKVGATEIKADLNFLASFTNYGKNTVDVFAPGYFLKTTYAGNKYAYRDGTSMAGPIVSGVAALVWSHYPKLSVSQLKQIILDSGVAYNREVQMPGKEDGVTKPFSEMSKSGKVVNAYNALLMAEQVSKQKQK